MKNSYCKVRLTRGLITIVSPEDFESVCKYRWYANKIRGRWSNIQTWVRGKHILLHRFILGLEKGDLREVDHWNRCVFDNRRENLRICTSSAGNQRNKKYRRRLHGYYKQRDAKRRRPYVAVVKINGRTINLGHFSTASAACSAYDTACRKLGVPGFVPNFPQRAEFPPAIPICLRKQRMRS